MELTADSYRKMGNEQFSSGSYDVALTLYSQAIAEESANDAQVLHHCNRSACYLAMDQAEDAATDAQLALEYLGRFMEFESVDTVKICQLHAKSSFRLAKALLVLANESDPELCQRYKKEAISTLTNSLTFLSQYKIEDELCKNYRIHLLRLKKSTEEPEKTSEKKVGIRDFELLQELGVGNFSRVVVAQNKKSGEKFALKIIEKKKAEQLAKRQHPNVYNEIQMERRILLEKLVDPCHPFIIKMHAAFQDYYSLYYLMDLHHDLSNSNKIHAELWESTRFDNFSVGTHFSLIPGYIAEVLEALQFCHDKGIVHRDLKPENVLIQENGHICLIDFGTAKDLQDTDLNGPEFVGTPEYMSPEAVKGSDSDPGMVCSYAMDYWALGVMIYNLYVGQTAFASPSQYLAFLKIRRGTYPRPDCIPDDAWDLISKLLVVDPSKRLGTKKDDIELIKQHPIFQNCSYTRNRVGRLSTEAKVGKRIPSLVDLCIRASAKKIKTDALSYDMIENTKRNEDALQLFKEAYDTKSRLHRIRLRVMHVLDRMFCMSSVRVRRNFYTNKQDMRLKRIRKGTRDVLGMSFAEQRYIMRQKQQQNEAMPWEDPHQSVVPFVYLTSPLFSTNISSIGIETREELLSELRQKILSINKKRPQFVIINSFQPPDNDTLKLLGKISETVSVILNDGSASNGFSIFPLHGSLCQGILLHLDVDSQGTPFIDKKSLNFIKGEMEASSVAGTVTFVAVNIDPLKLPPKLLRRLRYGKIMFVLGPNDDDTNGNSKLIWNPDDDCQLSDDDSDTNSLTGDEINSGDNDLEYSNTEKKILRMIRSNETQFYRIFEEDLKWETLPL